MFAKIPYRGSVVKNVMHEMDSQEKQSEVKGRKIEFCFLCLLIRNFAEKLQIHSFNKTYFKIPKKNKTYFTRKSFLVKKIECRQLS